MQYNTSNTFKPIYHTKKPSVKSRGAIDCTKLTNSHQLRHELMQEMLAIDTYQRNLREKTNQTDFSVLQTFKEMIQTRRQLLQKISYRID